MSSETLVFNGINAATGEYLLPPMSAQSIANLARGLPADANQKELKWRHQRGKQGHYGLKDGLDPKLLSQSGWGIIFASDASPELVECLSELIEFRREQASAWKEHFFKIYSGPDGYRAGETKPAFLARHGAGPGPANPEKVPYYLLIVGDPQSIPYSFQIQLDVQYAVGRISFDTLDEYVQYAHSVVAAEKQKLSLPRNATFFGVANPDDPATNLSADRLVSPLAAYLAQDPAGWQVDTILRDDATKKRLAKLIGGEETPALLFTASHGLSFPYDPKDPSQQLAFNGSLLCQDWPGPKAWKAGKLPEEYYFAGKDVGPDGLLGLIAFHFACYGAGTPHMDEFAKVDFKEKEAIAPYSFISQLPKKMLAHPKGGALAVVGHVERAWSYSFNWGNAGDQLAVFESSIKRLIDGHPVGSAFERFNERYAELASDLSVILEDQSFGAAVDEYELAGMWTANNDARNYVVLGDPAVRLMVGDESPEAAGRDSIEIRSPEPGPSTPAGEAAITSTGTAGTASPQTPVTSTAPVTPPPYTPYPVDYGLIDSLRQASAGAGTSIQNFLERLGNFLSNALDDAATLEVATYVSDHIDTVRYENGKFTGARLKALTRLKIDGDTLVCVPEEDGEVDLELWKIHTDMLQHAQASRAELMRTMVSAASGLSSLLKP